MLALPVPSRIAATRLRALALLLPLTASVIGCGDDATVASESAAAAAPPAAPTSAMVNTATRPAFGPARELAADQSQSTGLGGIATTASPPHAPGPPNAAALAGSSAVAASSMVIRTGSASVQVDSLEIAIAAVQRSAVSFGGYVGNTALALGENQLRSATIELRIPAARFDAAITGLTPIGRVESVTSEAQDVGEEFVDLTARVANARRLEARLIDLLENRTGRLQDALAVERELSRVREEIERIEGRARFLSARASMSTLVVSLHERAPLVAGSPGQNILLDAATDAWRNFVRFLAALIASLGVLVPLGAMLGLALAAWKRWQRAQRPPVRPAFTSDAS